MGLRSSISTWAAQWVSAEKLPAGASSSTDSPSAERTEEASPTSSVVAFRMRGCRELLLTYEDSLTIKSQIEVIEASIATNAGMVFTHCRGVIESVCRTILIDRGVPIDGADPKPNWLMSQTLKALKLTPTEFDGDAKVESGVSEVLRGMNALVNGIVDLRNSQGIGPHGRDALASILDPEYAVICATAVDAAASLIFRLHKKQSETDPMKRLRLGDHPDFDARLDASYSLFVEDVPLIASKSLFASDPDAYRQKLVEYLAAPKEDAEEFAEGEAVVGDAE
jgi:hypothetical protein